MAATAHPEVNMPFNREAAAAVNQPRKKAASSAWLIMLLVILVGIGAARLVLKGQTETPKIRVVAATADIPAGTRLGYTNLRYMDLPKPYWTPQMVSSTNLLVGRCAREYICKDEPLTSMQILPERSAIDSELGPDERAVTLKLPEESMVDHALEPGDFVDVIYTTSHKGEKYTRTICQRTRVLLTVSKEALASRRVKTGDASRITLAVSSKDSEILAHAEESGKLKLVLRNRSDSGRQNLTGIKDSDIFPEAYAPTLVKNQPVLAPPPPVAMAGNTPVGQTQPLPEAPVTANWLVEMFTGSHKEVYAVPQTGK